MEKDPIKKHTPCHKDENYYKTMIRCECGSETTRNALYNHLKSKKHKAIINQKQVSEISKDDQINNLKQTLELSKAEEINHLKQNLILSTEVINLKHEIEKVNNKVEYISFFLGNFSNFSIHHNCNNETEQDKKLV